ncbi:hypothetical protein NLX83_16340 [Allokutzneria sp. A3M-2-11 16]|uniref:hypothetical protein n=1 Tax=Allokutzneria sp. A3M-2-11 16 TaxID=2962043 RepID=UPI0020B6E452|nr:hypothetical protein [Allokutzneria sp. A3M-2-11 16]MCP3800835.1 hypothetical protein [Allokutzneria sp. A3M-2-11 16]
MTRERAPAWRTGFVIGYGLAMALHLLLLVTGELWNPAEGAAVQVVALFIAPAVLGGLPGLAVGLAADRLRGRKSPVPQQLPSAPPERVRDRDAWDRLLTACEGPVRRAEDVTAALPPSPARDWLAQITEAMRAELPAARSLAETGKRLHPPNTPSITTQPVYVRLKAAVEQFAAAERRIAEVAGELAAQPDLGRVDDQLRLLEQQLPHLRSPEA